ncbi:YitT family protein [Microbacterium sp. Marseille-Q6965]|uniref:membrane protein YczE n=1 Tax=Microbacterium sp. Marseille-Q6965 TaxID=2965072 RepID=UPI0021B77462|nr:hypothetical protein [Microbacterium sp. Marseille-Q6965]
MANSGATAARTPGSLPSASVAALTLRTLRLILGLAVFGIGVGLTVIAGLGLDPWTVLADGIARRTGIGIGWTSVVLGALVLLVWIPLRQRPGVGTVLNVLLVGTVMQVTVDLLPRPDHLALQVVALLAGIVVVAVGSGIYIGAHLGPGPRDGLMTGLRQRFGWPHWRGRATVELTVLALGWLLGGSVGIGTVLFAVLIGPLVHVALRLLDPRERAARRVP